MRAIPPVPETIWKNPLHFIAFGFGTGALPVAPGTFGTLIAVPIYLALSLLPPLFYIAIVLLITLISIWICDRVNKEINTHDHMGMNIDEIVGFLITMIFAPIGLKWIIIGFLLFRFFDIIKPWPIGYLDRRVQGGLGVILDDVVAGIFSLIILQILARIF